MFKASLPKQVDVRKLASKSAEFSAKFAPTETPRFADALASEDGHITVEMQLYMDEQYRRRVDGKVSAKVFAVCQRCLGPVECEVNSEFSLAVVWNDDDAKALPKTLEPLIIGEDEPYDLIDIVEEELLLSLPYVNYHDDMACVNQLADQVSLDDGKTTESSLEPVKKPSPFDILAELKKDS